MFAMIRFAATLSLIFLANITLAQEPATGPAGKWKFRFTEEGKPVVMLLMFSEDNGKWVGDFLGSNAKLPQEPKISSVKVTGDSVQFVIGFGTRELVNFDGLLAKDSKKITGSFSLVGGPLRLTEIYPSKLRKLEDPFEVAREDLAQMENGDGLFEAGFLVASMAAEKKLKPEDARGIADKIGKASASYGPRWERITAVRLAQTFAAQEGFADVALAQIRRAERMLTDDDSPSIQIGVLQPLADLLTKTGKADDAKKYMATIAKLESRDAADYAKSTLTFETPAFTGRKAKSDRVAVVELFTGTESPLFAAADVAFDGLLKTYKPADVVLLHYHFHVPSPNPLTSPDGVERVGYYAGSIRTAPALFINGKVGPKPGGAVSAAKSKYTDFKLAVDAELEKPATAKLALTVTKDDAGYTVKAAVTDLDKPGEKVTLRFMLVEDVVRFDGGNGVRYHHNLVRATPGGAKGFALTKKAHDQTVTIKPGEIRDALTKYLDKYSKEEGEFARSERPLALRNLKLIAIIQDDTTNEILQAAQVDLN